MDMLTWGLLIGSLMGMIVQKKLSVYLVQRYWLSQGLNWEAVDRQTALCRDLDLGARVPIWRWNSEDAKSRAKEVEQLRILERRKEMKNLSDELVDVVLGARTVSRETSFGWMCEFELPFSISNRCEVMHFDRNGTPHSHSDKDEIAVATGGRGSIWIGLEGEEVAVSIEAGHFVRLHKGDTHHMRPGPDGLTLVILYEDVKDD